MASSNLKPYRPGQSGNPKGRPVGARSKLGEAFLEALQNDFAAHGAAVIVQVRETKPDQYLKVIASILPRELNVSASSLMDDWSDEELAAAIRELNDVIREQSGIDFSTPISKRDVN